MLRPRPTSKYISDEHHDPKPTPNPPSACRLPSSRRFLREYKQRVGTFKSLYLPHGVSYALCRLWERFSASSKGQLPPVYNRRQWHAYWKKTRYSNEKLKTRVGWRPQVPMVEGLGRCFSSYRKRDQYA